MRKCSRFRKRRRQSNRLKKGSRNKSKPSRSLKRKRSHRILNSRRFHRISLPSSRMKLLKAMNLQSDVLSIANS